MKQNNFPWNIGKSLWTYLSKESWRGTIACPFWVRIIYTGGNEMVKYPDIDKRFVIVKGDNSRSDVRKDEV
jgi:hypothetical protein